MKGYDVIHELYYGNIAPNERGFHQDTIYGSAMEALSTHEEWLNQRLSSEEKKRFEELMSCHSTIVDTMAYESFRSGLQLGVMLIMDAVSDSRGALYDL